MKKPLLALVALLSLAAAAPAQTPSRSDQVFFKIKKLDVLIQIVPLALTPEQYPPILKAIETVHQHQRELVAQEDKDLATIDALVSQSVDDAVGKEKYPTHETQNKVASMTRAIGLRRSLFFNDSVDIVFQACKTTLNEGQIKAMEKSLKPELLDPSIKVDQMDSDAKVKFFIRKVILDPVAYDLLVQMSHKKAAEGG